MVDVGRGMRGMPEFSSLQIGFLELTSLNARDRTPGVDGFDSSREGCSEKKKKEKEKKEVCAAFVHSACVHTCYIIQ